MRQPAYSANVLRNLCSDTAKKKNISIKKQTNKQKQKKKPNKTNKKKNENKAMYFWSLKIVWS